jgi:protein-disulfide isomerase
MLVARRFLLSLVAASPALASLPARADEAETRADRAIGKPDAKTTVQEFYSATCSHCAAFARETFTQIKSELIDTGKLRWVFRDFPLDQLALTAEMVARYLPPERYEPFLMALFASQDRWAFARGINNQDELWKIAALAGMSKETFTKAVNDASLRTWILQQQDGAQKRWGIDSTPSFVVNGEKYSGEMSFDAFRKLIPAT